LLLHGRKYVENCGNEAQKLRTSEKFAIAELRLRINIALKSCGIAIAEVLPSSCGIAIADSKKVVRAQLCTYYKHRLAKLDANELTRD
jgi:hypothetical protein